jgi:hypothetical protein
MTNKPPNLLCYLLELKLMKTVRYLFVVLCFYLTACTLPFGKYSYIVAATPTLESIANSPTSSTLKNQDAQITFKQSTPSPIPNGATPNIPF